MMKPEIIGSMRSTYTRVVCMVLLRFMGGLRSGSTRAI